MPDLVRHELFILLRVLKVPYHHFKVRVLSNVMPRAVMTAGVKSLRGGGRPTLSHHD